MKKVIQYFACALAFMIVAWLCIYLFMFKPLQKERAQLIPKVQEAELAFNQCTADLERDCRSLLTEDLQTRISSDKWREHQKIVTSKLGKRISSEMDVSSVKIHVFNSLGSSKTVAAARFKVIYEKDRNAQETYEFIDSGKGFLVESFSVSSDELIK